MAKKVPRRGAGTDGAQKPGSEGSTKGNPKMDGLTRNPSHPTNQALANSPDRCAFCEKALKGGPSAYVVEEEIGRAFCSDQCIIDYFNNDVEQLEQEYFNVRPEDDFALDEQKRFGKWKWETLRGADEVWRVALPSGDYRYHLISEGEFEGEDVWCICMALFLGGEPSFVYLSFVTRSEKVRDHYRQGEQIQWLKDPGERKSPTVQSQLKNMNWIEKASPHKEGHFDREAEPWTASESFRAELIRMRRADDIPRNMFSYYDACIEETIQSPDEVWSIESSQDESQHLNEDDHLYHFLRYYEPDEQPDEPAAMESSGGGYWYIVVARDAESDDESIEVLDSFPTNDSQLAARYRCGTLEVEQQKAEKDDSQRQLH